MNYQKLFDHMFQEHGLTLTEGEMQDIVNASRTEGTTTMKELIEKYKKSLAFNKERLILLEEDPNDTSVMRNFHFGIIGKLEEVIADLESLQSKGKTKEEVLDYVLEYNHLGATIQSASRLREAVLQAMEEYAQSHANKDGWVSVEDYWMTAPIEEVRHFLNENIDMEEYEKNKQLLMEKIESKRRQTLIDKYIQTHCGNYTDKEKVVTINALQVGWEMGKHHKPLPPKPQR